MTVFDTARAYGDNECLLARGLRRCVADAGARIATKGGMTRAGGGWIPDGRAKASRRLRGEPRRPRRLLLGGIRGVQRRPSARKPACGAGSMTLGF
jgi:hypothetical protein